MPRAAVGEHSVLCPLDRVCGVYARSGSIDCRTDQRSKIHIRGRSRVQRAVVVVSLAAAMQVEIRVLASALSLPCWHLLLHCMELRTVTTTSVPLSAA